MVVVQDQRVGFEDLPRQTTTKKKMKEEVRTTVDEGMPL